MKSGGKTEILVIGSGPGGAVTALELASAGREVLVVEEGGRHGLSEYGAPAPQAMRKLYRRRGMTPITGPVPMGYVEGCCVGGSSEINCGFWQRAHREILLGWNARWGLADAAIEDLEPHYRWAEELLRVGPAAAWPASTRLFARGVEAMGWSAAEVSRAAPGCESRNACGNGCPTGAKQGMSRVLIPGAEAAGARVMPHGRVLKLIRQGSRIKAAIVRMRNPDGSRELVQIEADNVFVCAGPTETPALLRRSGINHRVGNTLRVHPMLKLGAWFDEEVNAHETVLPLLQVKSFWPEITMGGAFYSLGHIALLLSENWPQNHELMKQHRHLASYYIVVKGSGRGYVRPMWFDADSSLIFYQLSRSDLNALSQGMARLAALLLAAGAREVYPSVYGLPVIRNASEAMRWMDQQLPRTALSLTTVHAFSSCPIGEKRELCAADSFGKIYDLENLYLNDASMLPDSPGANPQATIMAVSRRNVLHFLEPR